MIYTLLTTAFLAVLILREYYPASAMRSDGIKAYGWLTRIARKHYVQIIFAATFLFCVWALWLGLARVPNELGKLLEDLRENAGNDAATRSIITAITALIAGIAIFGTIIVQAIRVWTNERQISTIEQGHVTDRITKAVEQLGAEKTVKRILKDADGNEVRNSDNVPVVIETTVPNLEVRLGGIYALERIAQDSERDHITIMEILCAYIRENAKASDAPDHALGEFKDYDDPSAPDRDAYRRERAQKLRTWVASLPQPRIDIQAALTVIGRRNQGRREAEVASNFKLDLRGSNLRRTNLSNAHFECADLSGVRMEGADLSRAWINKTKFIGSYLDGAKLLGCRLETGDLRKARLESADLTWAQLNYTNFSEARLEGVEFFEARLERANLRHTRLEGAYLFRAQMNWAKLRGSGLEGADLVSACLEWADLRDTRIKGTIFVRTNLRNTIWDGASTSASPAHFADFRGASGLTQAILDPLIGNIGTLLPEEIDFVTRKAFYVWSCWESPPDDSFLEFASGAIPHLDQNEREAIRATFICSIDNLRQKTGTRLALDAPYPEGHPLAKRARS